ncbi:hypothetical protein ACFE04_007989 [Oxalis oulophora]
MTSVYNQCFSSIMSASSSDKNSINPKFGCKNNNEVVMMKKGFSLSASSSLMTEFATKTVEVPVQTRTRQLADRYRQGLAIEGGIGYRQMVVIRSSEVGVDKNATIECILNLLQETAINHLKTPGIVGDGFGVTPGMLKNNLIWIVTKLTVEIDHYPTWDEVLEVDTWLRPSGKNGVQKDWTIKNLITGQILGRATSNWMMMNEKTRRLSKIPEEVKPKRSDIDMNYHVNNVKYSNWMLEVISETILEECQLSSITLEFRRECGVSETIQSLCQPEEDDGVMFAKYEGENSLSGYLQYLLESGISNNNSLNFTHLLQTEGNAKNEEIVRGRTTWKRRNV